MSSPIAILKHADRIAWHSFCALLFVAAGVAVDVVMCRYADVYHQPLATTGTGLNGPFGTQVITRLPCGVHGLLVNNVPIDLSAARAADACFTPSPGVPTVDGQVIPDSLFSVNASLCIIASSSSGWPMCCLEGFRVVQITSNPLASTTSDVSLIALSDAVGVNPRWSIPTHPRWFPLAVNFTVGFVLSILFSGVARARRRKRRARRGLCPACAYTRAKLSKDAPCPECGTAPSV